MFTKQQYVFLAEFLRRRPLLMNKDITIRVLARKLEQDNPRFDKAKFIKACY